MPTMVAVAQGAKKLDTTLKNAFLRGCCFRLFGLFFND